MIASPRHKDHIERMTYEPEGSESGVQTMPLNPCLLKLYTVEKISY